MNVLDELPSDIRKQYKSVITLHNKSKQWFQNKKRKIIEKPKEKLKLDDSIIIPSFSQLDNNTIKSFPNELQYDIIKKSINIHDKKSQNLLEISWYNKFMKGINFSNLRKDIKLWINDNYNKDNFKDIIIV